MKCRVYLVTITLLVLSFSLSTVSDDLFSGTWCVGREGLLISFVGKDSIHVTSLEDESIDGWGTYKKKGTTLTATLKNEDLQLKMGYRYKVREDSTIRAKILFFTVNGDSVNHPKRWLGMAKCDPEKGIFREEDEEEEQEED